MAISHADHDHPNTPAARAACRKALNEGNQVLHTDGRYKGKSAKSIMDLPEPAPMFTVMPRTRGDGGVVKGLKNSKKPGTQLRTIGDLPDVPRMLAYGARLAWANEWPVRVGEKFNDTESRIVIDAPAGEIAMVWRASLPNGVWGVFFRPGYGSVTNRVDSVQEAFELGAES